MVILDTKLIDEGAVSLVKSKTENWFGVLDEESGDIETFDTPLGAMNLYDSIVYYNSLYKAFGWAEEE